ncbi:MAG: HEAT repeat domain-containing protein [Anaerolineae bacterium]|nr:HEAT repeat domain-containing protein [Anaerolineae bacterium]
MNQADNQLELWDAAAGLIDVLRNTYLDEQQEDEPSRHLGEAAIPALLDALSSTTDDRREAVAAILDLVRVLVSCAGSEHADQPLIDALQHPDPGVRCAAARAAGWLGHPELVSPLVEAITTESPALRRNVAEALGRIGDAEALPALMTALEDDDESVRYSAAWAMGRIGDIRSVSELVGALRDDHPQVRRAAARSLGWIGDSIAVPGLAGALSDERSGVRRDAAMALGAIGSEAAVKELKMALSDRRAVVRYSAAAALGQIGSDEPVPELLSCLNDEDADVRRVSAEALRMIGDPRAIPGLVRALRRAQAADNQPDMYALGLALYDMLTASLPGEARDLTQIRLDHVDPATDFDIPAEEVLAGLAERDRVQSIPVKDLVDRVEELIRKEPLVAEDIQRAATRISAATPPPDEIDMPGGRLVAENGIVIQLRIPQTVIGRGVSDEEGVYAVDLQDLEIDEARTASRHHCRLFFEDNKWWIEDLGSLNGTWVNKKEARQGSPRALKDGDRVVIGSVKVTFEGGG